MAITKDYKEYLKSRAWQKKRLKVLTRAKFICERCHRRQATQIHHLTYDRIFHERLKDLQAICGPCHMEIHGIEDGTHRKVGLFGRFKRVYQRVIG